MAITKLKYSKLFGKRASAFGNARRRAKSLEYIENECHGTTVEWNGANGTTSFSQRVMTASSRNGGGNPISYVDFRSTSYLE
jgi:hypothetical protein